MHTVAFIFNRVPGMSVEAFHDYYEHRHGPLMVELLRHKGLVSYDHYPVREAAVGDEFVPAEGPAYDALSIYSFSTAAQAAAAWAMPELIEDSKNFIDFDTMVTLPLNHRQVFPRM